MEKYQFIPLPEYERLSIKEMSKRSVAFHQLMKRRRTVREFSEESVPREVIEKCILAAGTAPSGANRQPWHFVVIGDEKIKKTIRLAAEKEEHEFYTTRAPRDWLEALAPLGTTAEKPFLETAPYLIAIFGESYEFGQDGEKTKNYYVNESVGIATGMLITAIHKAGLVSLTHTPSPMGFLNRILHRPKNERPFLILVVGFPKEGTTVPAITKKPLSDIVSFLE